MKRIILSILLETSALLLPLYSYVYFKNNFVVTLILLATACIFLNLSKSVSVSNEFKNMCIVQSWYLDDGIIIDGVCIIDKRYYFYPTSFDCGFSLQIVSKKEYNNKLFFIKELAEEKLLNDKYNQYITENIK